MKTCYSVVSCGTTFYWKRYQSVRTSEWMISKGRTSHSWDRCCAWPLYPSSSVSCASLTVHWGRDDLDLQNVNSFLTTPWTIRVYYEDKVLQGLGTTWWNFLLWENDTKKMFFSGENTFPLGSWIIVINMNTRSQNGLKPLGGFYWGADSKNSSKIETGCLPSCSLHLGSHWEQVTGWRTKGTHSPDCGFVQPLPADGNWAMPNISVSKKLGYFVYPLDGF